MLVKRCAGCHTPTTPNQSTTIAAAGVHALAASIGIDHALGAQDISAINAWTVSGIPEKHP